MSRDPAAWAAYIREHKAERRARLDAIKLAAGCVDCGYNGHPRALQFDHLPGVEKVAHISDLVHNGRPWGMIEAEIAKCEVVCANCHAIRTSDRLTVAA